MAGAGGVTPLGAGPIDWVTVSRRAAPIAVILVGLSWAGTCLVGGRRPAPNLRPFARRAFPGAQVEPTSPGIFTARCGPELRGYAAAGTGDGYSGPVTVAVATDPEGRIRALALLAHRDTPAIARSGLPLLQSLLGKSPDEPFRAGADVDAVSGATQTSTGLALAARAGLHTIAEHALAQSVGEDQGVLFGPPEAVLLAVLLIAVLGKNHPWVPARSRRLLRTATLLAGLVALGFLFARPWVIALPIRLLSGDWPSWRTHLYWYVLLASVALSFSRSGKSVYCPWICPFGAAQDVLGLVGGGHRRHLPRPLLFAWVKGALLWLAVLLGLVYRNPAPASYEVFGTFFRLSGTAPQFAVLAIVLLTAVFYSRPFCHWVCPVDPAERVLRPARRWLARRGRAATLAPRTLRVLHPSPPPSATVFGRLREGLLVAAGLLCAALVVAHLVTSVPDAPGAGESGLLGATFVSVEAPRVSNAEQSGYASQKPIMSEMRKQPCVEFESDRLEPRLKLEVRGQVEAISPAVDQVLAVIDRMGCAAGKEFEVETAVREALANAIRHGCARDPDKKVQVCVACDDARGMLIVVRDPGPGFDLESIPSPVQGENLFSQGGRGIFLINELMDDVSFERGGTEIHMRKR